MLPETLMGGLKGHSRSSRSSDLNVSSDSESLELSVKSIISSELFSAVIGSIQQG